MAEDFSNWEEDDDGGAYAGDDGGDGSYQFDAVAGPADDGSGVQYEEDGGIEDDEQTYQADGSGTIEEGDEEGAEDGEEYVAAGGEGEAEEEVYAEDGGDGGEYVEGGDGDQYAEEDDGTYDQTYDQDGGEEGEQMGEAEEEAEEEEEAAPAIDPATMSALDAARRKALSGRFGGAAPAATSAAPSAFGSAFGATRANAMVGGSAFGSAPAAAGGPTKPSAFAGASAFGGGSAFGGAGTTASTAAFTGFAAAATAGKSDKASAFGGGVSTIPPKASAFQVSVPTPAATVPDAKSERLGKREKREKHKKDKATKSGGGEIAGGDLDASPDSLQSRSKRFSNMVAPSPTMSSSPSVSPMPFLGGPPAGRSTAAMMAAAMGGGGGGGGEEEDGDLFTASNFRAIVGQCHLMCPVEEQQARQESRDLSYFEIIPGTGSKEHGDVPLVDPQKAVKKYKRAAAAQTLNAKDVRPPHILQQTMSYLVSQIMDRTDSPDPPPLPSFLVIYRFISDRMRALRQDFVCQQQKDPVAIKCYEIMVRFHILTMYELGDVNNIEKFDPTPNMEKLSQTLTSLRHMFFDNHTNTQSAPFPTPNEPEMHSYRLLMELDRKFGTLYEELDKFAPEVKASPIIQFCVGVYNAFRENNYARFFQLVRQAPYLHAVLLQGFFSKVRDRALEVMARAYTSYPFDAFVDLLGFEDGAHAARFLTHYGLEYEAGSPSIRFDKGAYHRPGSLFPFRNAHSLIADKRPERISQAVVKGVGAGEGIGLERASGMKPAAMPTRRQVVVKPKNAFEAPTPIASATMGWDMQFPSSAAAATSQQVKAQPFAAAPTAATLPVTQPFGGFSSGASGAVFGGVGGFGLPPSPAVFGGAGTPSFAAPSAPIDTKPTKITRKVEPTGVAANATAAAPSAFGGLNPQAPAFVPFGTSGAEVAAGGGANAPSTVFGGFSGLSKPPSGSVEKTASSIAPWANPPFLKDESMRSAGSAATQPPPPSASSSSSKPATPKSSISGFSVAFPTASGSIGGGVFPPTAANSTSSTASSTSTKPPTPLLPPLAGKDATMHISGFTLPAVISPSPQVPSLSAVQPPAPSATLPPTTSGFGLTRATAMSGTMMDTSSSGAEARPTYSLGLTPTTMAGGAHPRPPIPHSSSSFTAKPMATPAPPPPPPQPVVRSSSPSPAKAERWFLSALHQYKSALLKVHLRGWVDLARTRAAATQLQEQAADRFARTKWFLRWHAAYVHAATYRQQFNHAQEMLHAPTVVAMRLTPQKHKQPPQQQQQHLQPVPRDAVVPFRSSPHVPTTPSRALVPTSVFLHPSAASAAQFISPSAAGMGFGLTSPFQRLAMLGVPVQADTTESYEEEGEDDQQMDLAPPDFTEAEEEDEQYEEEQYQPMPGDQVDGEEEAGGEEQEGGEEEQESAEADHEEGVEYGEEDDDEAQEEKYHDEEEPMEVEGDEDQGLEYAEEDDHPQAGPTSAFLNGSFHSASAFASPQRPAGSTGSAPGSAALLSPSKSGLKRSRLPEQDAATPSRRTQPPQQQPAATFHDLANGDFPHDVSDQEEEAIESSPQRAKLFHTPSRLAARAVFSPDKSSKDLLDQLREEMDRTRKLSQLMDALEKGFSQPPPRW